MKREASDAPVHFNADEASAWAVGFDAGLEWAARTASRYVWNESANPDHGNVIAARIREDT